MPLKIALSGASGFVGQAVLRELLKLPVSITVMSRQPLLLPAEVTCVAIDLHQLPNNCFDLLGCPDVLIHLAWQGLPNYQARYHFERELPAQYQFLKQLIEAGLPQLVISGSCAEYGLQQGELHEALTPQPNTPYAYAKHALHQQLRFLQTEYPFQLLWARLFYLYGEGQAASSLYQQLQQAIRLQQTQFNMSLGQQLRDFLPIETVARHLTTLAMGCHDTTVNICSGNPISVRAQVEAWLQQAAYQLTLNLGFYPYPRYEPIAFWGSNHKLTQLLAGSNC